MYVKANDFTPGWGQTIFQSANEMANNAILRKRVDEHQAKVQEEQEWWDRKRASIQEGFMKELDEESAAAKAASAPVVNKASTVGSRSTASSVVGERIGSDDDAVLVEGGGPAASGGGKGGNKKKKGKK